MIQRLVTYPARRIGTFARLVGSHVEAASGHMQIWALLVAHHFIEGRGELLRGWPA